MGYLHYIYHHHIYPDLLLHLLYVSGCLEDLDPKATGYLWTSSQRPQQRSQALLGAALRAVVSTGSFCEEMLCCCAKVWKMIPVGRKIGFAWDLRCGGYCGRKVPGFHKTSSVFICYLHRISTFNTGYRMVPPSYKLVYKPINYSYICHKP